MLPEVWVKMNSGCSLLSISVVPINQSIINNWSYQHLPINLSSAFFILHFWSCLLFTSEKCHSWIRSLLVVQEIEWIFSNIVKDFYQSWLKVIKLLILNQLISVNLIDSKVFVCEKEKRKKYSTLKFACLTKTLKLWGKTKQRNQSDNNKNNIYYNKNFAASKGREVVIWAWYQS